MKEITALSAIAVAKKIKERQVSVKEVLEAQLATISEREALYNSYITVMEEEALKQAISVQEQIDKGVLIDSPLAGVPIAIKDNIYIKGIRTTCGSKVLENFVPSFDAAVIERLKKAGAIIIGKVNLDEFAMGGTTKTSYFGETKNPWNISHTSGGSSGGSASAVAAEEAFVSLGTDTGGSIRQPAAFCGLVGFKPTYGTVPSYGLIPFALSLDQIGPLARNISDAVAVLEVISGYDSRDFTSIRKKKYSYSQALVDDVKGMRIGVPKLYLEEDLDKDIRECFLSQVKALEDMGAKVEVFELEGIEYSAQIYYVIACAEASWIFSKYKGVRPSHIKSEYHDLEEIFKNSKGQDFGYELKRRIMLGAYVISSDNYEIYYNKARRIRRVIYNAYQEAFNRYDILMSPESLKTAPLLSDNKVDDEKHRSEILNASVNLAGGPGVTIPCGRDKKGLPIGIQLVGKRFGEEGIIRAAYALEQINPYKRPKTLCN